MEAYEYKGYTINPNVHRGEGEHADTWVFEAATIVDSAGNEVPVVAPTNETPHYFESEEKAARVCISQAKALIEAGDLG